MPNCIYCPATDLTQEHHLPRGLGSFKGYVPLADRVCVRHNGICGQLDEQLCRCGSEAFFRKALGISGRKRRDQVNPFYRGSSGGGVLEMTGICQETGEEKELELLGPKSVQELRCVKLTAENDSTYTIRIAPKMTPEEFRLKVKALGIKFFKYVDISAAPEEIPWVESLFEGFQSEGEIEWTQPQGPIVFGPITVKFTLTDRYFRAIAKIGFHYFLTRFSRFRGDERCFSEIRDFIMNSSSFDGIERFVAQGRTQFECSLGKGQMPNAWGHLIAAESDYIGFRAKVQLFIGPERIPRVYTVRLGKNPSPIYYSEAYGSFFAYYPPEERSGFDGEVSELTTITLS